MNIFEKRYKELGNEIDLGINLKQSLRVNTLKIKDGELVERLLRKRIRLNPIPFVEHGYYVESRRHFSLSSTPEYLQGLFYFQEAAAQVPAEVLNPSKNDTVLDCCAAPGGKTVQLAQSSKAVVALEKNFKRLNVLLGHLERMGISNTVVYKSDARYFEELKFDKILADVPCSGNYVTDRNWFKKQSLKNIKERSKLQKEILENMANMLKPNGEIVYSTCTLEPEEDELVVQWALDNLDLELLPTGLKVGSPGLVRVFDRDLDQEIELCRRFWPNKTMTQGFFIAKFMKK